MIHKNIKWEKRVIWMVTVGITLLRTQILKNISSVNKTTTQESCCSLDIYGMLFRKYLNRIP